MECDTTNDDDDGAAGAGVDAGVDDDGMLTLDRTDAGILSISSLFSVWTW